jgi:hypothetical protein
MSRVLNGPTPVLNESKATEVCSLVRLGFGDKPLETLKPVMFAHRADLSQVHIRIAGQQLDRFLLDERGNE